MDIKLASIEELAEELDSRCFACVIGCHYYVGPDMGDMLLSLKGEGTELVMLGGLLGQYLKKDPEAIERFRETTLLDFIHEMRDISQDSQEPNEGDQE